MTSHDDFSERRDDVPIAALKELLRSTEAPVPFPPWFSAQLMQRVRAGREPEDDGAMGTLPSWVQKLLDARTAWAGLLGALLIGAWVGFQDAQVEVQHRAEVRYLDVIDPVHTHP